MAGTTKSKKAPIGTAPSEPEVIDQAPPITESETTSALAELPPDTQLNIVGGLTTRDLQSALSVQTEQRALIKTFVQDHLVEGTDFGKIHISKSCQNPYTCKLDYHFSKAMLYKPGQEKLFSLFQITDELQRDDEMFQMLPNTTGLIAFKCVMYRNSHKIGEGRGAAVVDAKRDPNSTIKMAEKRARMDACLSLGFSEYFSQDLDDPENKSAADEANRQAAARADALDRDEFGLYPRDAKLPIDNTERVVLNKAIVSNGFTKEETLELLRANGITEPTTMTSGQARQMLRKLKDGVFTLPTVEKPDDVITDVDGVDLYKAVATAESELPDEEELVVDDELKQNLIEQWDSLTLNIRGQMWLRKYVSGKPYAKFEAFTDPDWRKTYEAVQAILDGKIIVEADYLMDSSEPHVVIDPLAQRSPDEAA